MIPQIIHYCWFGPKRMPRTVRRCIETWHQLMPDYEFMLWNESNSPMQHPFVASAYAAKKYAFVADYVRFWALYNYGGIYLDTDMYVVKRFDDLLNNEFFAGYENEKDINVAIAGSKKQNTLTYQILTKYDSLIFDKENMMTYVIPQLITPLLANNQSISLYPYDYFYPFPFTERTKHNFIKYKTGNTYTIHLWDISWYPWYKKIIRQIVIEVKKIKKAFTYA